MYTTIQVPLLPAGERPKLSSISRTMHDLDASQQNVRVMALNSVHCPIGLL